MAEDRDELLQHYGRMREELASAIEGLSDSLMTEPSIDGWSVKDHLAHVAFWNEIRAAEVTRISAGHDGLAIHRSPGRRVQRSRVRAAAKHVSRAGEMGAGDIRSPAAGGDLLRDAPRARCFALRRGRAAYIP